MLCLTIGLTRPGDPTPMKPPLPVSFIVGATGRTGLGTSFRGGGVGGTRQKRLRMVLGLSWLGRCSRILTMNCNACEVGGMSRRLLSHCAGFLFCFGGGAKLFCGLLFHVPANQLYTLEHASGFRGNSLQSCQGLAALRACAMGAAPIFCTACFAVSALYTYIRSLKQTARSLKPCKIKV